MYQITGRTKKEYEKIKGEIKDIRKGELFKQANNIARKLSFYGAQVDNYGNPFHEMVSEARAEVLCLGQLARPFSKRVYKALMELKRDSRRKVRKNFDKKVYELMTRLKNRKEAGFNK